MELQPANESSTARDTRKFIQSTEFSNGTWNRNTILSSDVTGYRLVDMYSYLHGAISNGFCVNTFVKTLFNYNLPRVCSSQLKTSYSE